MSSETRNEERISRREMLAGPGKGAIVAGTIAVATGGGLDVVTLTAVTAGSGGNAITLAVSTTPAAGFTASAATLTGGGAAGSLVGDGVITIEDCDLVASGVAAYQIRADTSGHIRVRGGTWRGSDNASLSTASNCALLSVAGVEWANDFEVAYDTGIDRPNDAACEYLISDISRAGAVLSNLVGAGSLTVSNCPSMTTLSQAGDPKAKASGRLRVMSESGLWISAPIRTE